MYIVPIGWLYVALMMSVAEATNTNGSVLGGILTFILYGILPTSIMVYLMRTPERKKARLALEKAQTEAAQVQVDNKTTTTTNSETNVTKA